MCWIFCTTRSSQQPEGTCSGWQLQGHIEYLLAVRGFPGRLRVSQPELCMLHDASPGHTHVELVVHGKADNMRVLLMKASTNI